jgi:uncharacterized protein
MTADTISTTGRLSGPVTAGERIDSVDVLRGFALLGILAINIDFFALPMAIYSNPPIAGGFAGLDLLTWKSDFLFFLQKMMAIFSMLFGAGFILMYNRAKEAREKFGGTYYRRILWLLVIGMIHGYLLWFGDILVSYALCGLLLYPLRRRSPRFLIAFGVFFLLLGGLVSFGIGYSILELKNQAIAAEEAQKTGEEISPEQNYMRDMWDAMHTDGDTYQENVAIEIESYRGDFGDVISYRIGHTLMMQTQGFLIRVFWRVMGLMLLGMAFMKMGVFSGERSPRFYVIMIVLGYGIGLPVCGYGMGTEMGHDFEIIHFFKIGSLFNFFGSIPVALGHVGVIMLICRSGVLQWLTNRLSAVGRMAFTNYLMHTLICTTLFYGYGFGLFAHINRFGLFWIVVAIWILQLWLSPLWLKHFRFGPAEWLWRTLTYLKPQPMRVKESN